MSGLNPLAFQPPGPKDFDLPGFFHIGSVQITKPILELVLSAIVVFGFFWLAGRKRSMVPGRLQFAGESAYGMVRNSMARDIIGSEEFQKFVPYLVTLFFFILVNNFFGSVPVIAFPTLSKASMAYMLAGVSWVIYNGIGIRRFGFMGYLKHTCVPSGVTPVIYPLLVPLEFLSNIIVRPVTLALRLFCNMFAGHLLALLFAEGGKHLLIDLGGWYAPVGILAWLLAVAVGFLELLVQFLQAYVFVLLNAMYIAGALAEDH